MKKALLTAGISVITLASLSFALPSLDELLQGASRGYDNNHNIAIGTFGDQEIQLISPKIQDFAMSEVKEYHVLYANNYTDLLSGTYYETYFRAVDLRTDTNGLIIPISITNETFNPRISTGLDYFAMIVPVAFDDAKGQPSSIVCFNLGKIESAIGTACQNFGSPTSQSQNNNTQINNGNLNDVQHNASTDANGQPLSAGKSDMTLANVRHSITGGVITLFWTKVGSAADVAISVRGPGDTSFSRVATVRMNDEKYDFKYSKSGEYIFWFQPSDGGTEIRYTVDNVPPADPTPVPPANIPNVPQAGPKENAIAIAIFAVVLYGAYVIFGKQKA